MLKASRAVNPFVAVNCAGIPQTLLESELFGYDEGLLPEQKGAVNPGDFSWQMGEQFFSMRLATCL